MAKSILKSSLTLSNKLNDLETGEHLSNCYPARVKYRLFQEGCKALHMNK